MQTRLDQAPEMMRIRRQTVEHSFGTIKSWMGATHFLMNTLDRVSTEMSLHVLAYNLKRVMKLLGTVALMCGSDEGLRPFVSILSTIPGHPGSGRGHQKTRLVIGEHSR